MPAEVVLASGNAGKLEELQHALNPLGWTVKPQSQFAVPEVAETGLTFVENALIKARNACEVTGLAALADDSGLVVPALAGAPGLYSSRYSGEGDEGNNQLLLRNLAPFSQSERGAFFIAVVVLLRHAEDPTPVIAEGRWHGHIAMTPSGDGGFGYDPIFIPDGDVRRAAELSTQEKARRSHRGLAIQSLRSQLGL